jgi:serine/threonine protein kinase
LLNRTCMVDLPEIDSAVIGVSTLPAQKEPRTSAILAPHPRRDVGVSSLTTVLLSSDTRLGAFQIISVIGAGGMGEVYRARDTRLDRIVAVKILRPDKVRNLERFHREARVISRLSHPHICSLYDVGEQDGIPFLVMEYLEGQTLAERLEDGALAIPLALRYGVEICNALDAAHRVGVIHRDVKPGNVMLTRDGVKLLDFGLAKLKEADANDAACDATASLYATEEGEILGTVAYMSPEQLEGRQVDARTDLFALGAVLHEMIAGRRAFGGESHASVIAAVLTSDPPPLSTLQPLVPPTLERLVQRCLAKDREERWQTARDLGSELEWIAEGRSHVATLEKRRKGRVLLVGALVGAGLTSAILSGAWLLTERQSSHPSYQRITYRRGSVASARFAPDGHTIVYSASWEGRPYELFFTQLGSVESRPLGMPNSRILSISPKGEMAVLFGTQTMLWGSGTVAHASLAGGASRELVENAVEADWGPGEALAVVRRRDRGMALEFPIGTKLYEAGSIWWMRVSPRGDRVAFFAASTPWPEVVGELVVVDRSLKQTVLAKGFAALGLSWSPTGNEIWFTGAQGRGSPALHAASLSGRVRLIAHVPAWLMLQDISRDGRVLLTKGLHLLGITCLIPGESRERDFGWLDQSWVEGLSQDGKTLLFGEAGEGSWVPGAYIRNTDGSPAVRLGDGHPESLSPDGKWVLARRRDVQTSGAREWVLLPTGPGGARVLPSGPITQLVEGAWLPDGHHIVFTAIEGGKSARVYVQDVRTGAMRPITPEGVRMPEKAASPDGSSVLVLLSGKWLLYPIEGGEPRHLPFLDDRDNPRQWSADGRFLYVSRGGNRPPIQVERLDVTTGRREPWKTLAPADPVGIERLDSPVITPDGRGYCYSYARRLSELYVADGLK